jgi:hypothetical protein
MPTLIIKLADKYLEWSTISDSPATYGMSLDEFKSYYRDRYGQAGVEWLGHRLARVEAKDTSSFVDASVDETIACNRAGPNESKLSKEQIIEKYCVAVADYPVPCVLADSDHVRVVDEGDFVVLTLNGATSHLLPRDAAALESAMRLYGQRCSARGQK